MNQVQDVFSYMSPNDITESMIAMEKRFLQLYNLNTVYVGFEYEFYCLTKPSKQFFEDIASIDVVQEVKQETGHWQFEIVTIPQNSFIAGCNAMFWARQSLEVLAKKHNITISQKAATFAKALPPSSMQISIAMQGQDGSWLSSLNKPFLKCVQSLVHNLHSATFLTCPTPNCYLRFTNNAVAKEFKNSPTHINWGIENRTLAVRLASIYSSTSGQRIELRTPSPMANVHYVGLAVLSSLLCLSQIEYPQTFVDAWESGCLRLPQTITEATTSFLSSQLFHLINTFSYKHAI